MILRNFWYIAAQKGELDTKPIRRIIAGSPVALYRAPDGNAVALEDRCVHRDVPLSLGKILPDGSLQCLYHGIRFDCSGRCVQIPEQTRVPASARVKCYPMVERYEWVWIWMGDPALADPDAIPNYPWFERPGWKAKTARLHVNSNYRLVVDNLLNMAHIPFVHPRTIGNDGVVKDAKVTVKRENGRVRLSREMYDIEPPPTYKKAADFEGNVNRWQKIDFIPPSFFEFNTGVIDVSYQIPETAADENRSDARILSRHSMHGVVPETETSSHYYVGFCYDPERMTEETAEFVFDSVYKTFLEDVEILEAQQMNMDLIGKAPRLDIVSDAAGLQAARLIDELEQAEAVDGGEARIRVSTPEGGK